MNAEKAELILIGICTHNRHSALDRLFGSLCKLTLPIHSRVSLLIVENGAQQTIQHLVAAHEFPFPVDMVVEPAIGLVSARNRLLDEADKMGADYLICVDDDETVLPGWARGYEVGFKRLPRCSALMGWVDFAFEGKKSPWMTPQSFGREIFGQPRKIISSTNYGLRRNVFAKSDGLGLRFDSRYNTSGGEDSDFFLRLIFKHDGATATVPQARSVEYITPARATLRAMLKRAWDQNIVYYGIRIDLQRQPSGKVPRNAYLGVWQAATNFFTEAVRHLLLVGSGDGPVILRVQKNIGLFLFDFTRWLAFFGYFLGAKSSAYESPETGASGNA